MPTAIGTLGRLFTFKSPKVVPVTPGRRDFIEQSVEGANSAQVGLRAPRTWEVSIPSASTQEVASLLALGCGEYGIGPFIWVSPAAAALNLLTPEVSTCGPAADWQPSVEVSGPLNIVGEGITGRSLFNSDPSVSLVFGNIPTPVIPNTKVTGSAGVLGAGSRVGLSFWTAAGVYLNPSYLSAETGVAGEARRLSVTATAPSNAAYCLVYGTNTVSGARPAVTWTDHLNPWAPGGGCPKAHISNIPNTVSGVLRQDVSFTVTEMGVG